jgi:hypothetical protein
MLVNQKVFCDPRRGGCNTWTPVDIPLGNYVLKFTCPKCKRRSLIPIRLLRQTIYAYGDESSFGQVIAYGLVVIHAHNLLAAEQLLSG